MLKIPYYVIYGIAPPTLFWMILNYFYAKYIQKHEDEEEADA